MPAPQTSNGRSRRIGERKRTEWLYAAEMETLRMITTGASLTDVLTHVCASIDRQILPSITTILLMDPDGLRLWPIAGPKVPQEWTRAISPLPVDPDAGLCSTAAALKTRVIVPDLANERICFEEYRDLALTVGIRAGWSQPIVTKENQVLGTFAVYSPECRVPTDEDLALIEAAGHVTLLAIERQRSHEALTSALQELRRSEADLHEAQRLSHTGSWKLDLSSGSVSVSPEVFRIYAINPDTEITSSDFWFDRIHPEDRHRVRERFDRCVAERLEYEADYRIVLPDGMIKYQHAIGHPVLDQSGALKEFLGTSMDVTEQVQARIALEHAFEEITRLKDRLHDENLALKEEIAQASMFEEVVGASAALRAVLSRVTKVAPTESTVLLTGETGTGKELIARAIHNRSQRSSHAFVSVNCAAIPVSLIASELFGHEKGAFTGASGRRVGRFELAADGTIFLDEVGELSAETQVALLRVLQERAFERVGGNQSIRTNARVVAATNRDLEAAITTGTFRSDLFYRLNVFPIEIPPLRERREDIPLLVESFVSRFFQKAGKRPPGISKKTLDLLLSYPWPGNIRELQNVVERSVIVCETENFSVDESWLSRKPGAAQPKGRLDLSQLAIQEKEIIETALRESGGRVSGASGAAAKLGIPGTTLASKIKALGINKNRFKP